MYKSKTQPFKHQTEALDKSMLKRNFAYFMEMGCVDGETEFLTQRGWVKFKDFDLDNWERPLLVAQAFYENNDLLNWSYEFVEPEAYIKKDASDWYTLYSSTTKGFKRSFPYMFTSDHRIPLIYEYTRHNARRNTAYTVDMPDANAEYISKVVNGDKERRPYLPADPTKFSLKHPTSLTGGFRGFKSKYYDPSKNDISSLTPDEVRFMVAVVADGTYPNKTDNKVDFYFTKERKAIRLRMLAARAGIPLAYEKKRHTQSKKVIHVFHAIAPARCKIFDERWYSIGPDQLFAAASEVFYWDGHLGLYGEEFYTIWKESADFVQYALTCQGWYARIVYQPSKNLYRVSANRGNCRNNALLPEEIDPPLGRPGDHNVFNKGEFINEVQTAYCFRVPSGYLLIRRNDEIMVVGNSGKTKVMIDNIGELYDRGAITGALILAPKGVYRNWSEKEIPTHLSDEINSEILVWNAAASQGQKDKLLKRIKGWDKKSLQFMVFNIESLVSEKGKVLLSDFIKAHEGKVLALVDESTCIKNHKAKRTKAAIDIGKKCLARRIATGSPITNSPLDVFSQCAFLSKDLLGFGSYYAFKNTYANIEKVQNRQGQSYEKILSYKNLDELSGKLDKFSYRITKKECLDLPDKIYTTRDVELTDEQKAIYKEMSDYQFAMLETNGEFQEMSAQVILTKFLRLHQVLCGTFTADDGTLHRIPNKRVDALQEVLEETSGKVIIWATYLADIEAIAEMLEKNYGKESFVTYYGATSSDERVSAIQKFQDESSPVRFFLGNVQTAGRGITLTAASTVIYYSNNFSLELRQQSEDRAHRLGQKNKVTYIDLVVRNSLDEKIIKSLIEKRNIANEVLKDDLEQWITLSGA